jgi:hypothetical protein
MGMWDQMLLRGLRTHIPEGSAVLAHEVGKTDALGPMRKATIVLTDDALLVVTGVRARAVLTRIARADVRSVEAVDGAESAFVAVVFDDYARAIRRVVQLDLRKHGDRAGIIGQLRAAASGASSS